MKYQDDQQPLLEIKNLVIQFLPLNHQAPAVNNFSLTIGKKKFCAIVGESGSGKSVTALSVLSLLPSNTRTQGDIIFWDAGKFQNLISLSANNMLQIRGNRISMIFQEPMTSLNPIMRCGNQVMEVFLQHCRISHTDARKKTVKLFEEVELPQPEKIFSRYPHELSGGQRQRVMIAMAIASEPALLIADEPTTALDVRVQMGIVKLLKQLQETKGMSVLFITHDLGLVADIADEVVVMQKGKVVEAGPAKEVLYHPQDVYTKTLLSCRPAVNLPHTLLPEADREYNFEINKFFVQKSAIEQGVSLPLLRVKNLEVEVPDRSIHQNKKILGPISFEIWKGETVGLVGESGCGKTTLGRTIAGLQQPSQGSVWLEEQEILKLTGSAKRKLATQIQMVFQDPYGSLDPRITIGNAIMEPLKVHKIGKNNAERKEIAILILKKVKLPSESFYRYPHQFSGGQRQRICIARALVLQPELLIFDESVSALDVSVQAGILNLISELKEQLHFSILFISHDLSVIYHISNRIMVMQNGVIEEEGTANEVFNNPRQPYTRKLIEAIPGRSLGV